MVRARLPRCRAAAQKSLLVVLLDRMGAVRANDLVDCRVYLGPVANDDVRSLSDINAREFFMLSLLAIAVLYMGIFPHPFTQIMDTSVADFLKHVAQSKLN